MMEEKIWLSSPHMCGKEIEFIQNAFDTNWIAPLGPHVDGFENDICAYLNVPYATALSSGTAAIHLALILLNVQRDDFVICPSFTFSATANPILYQQATPVFVDSEKDTWNIDPELLEKSIQYCLAQHKKPKAIIVVHLYGMPAKMDEIISIAQAYNIPIIEDAAESFGSKYKNKYTGTFGKINALSFNGNKIITTSGGGALVSDNDELIMEAKFLATQARDTAPHYQHSHVGYNYRLSNICAAVGRGQMTVINERIKQRRYNYDFYVKQLSAIKGISFLNEPENHFSNRWLTTIVIDTKVTGFSREDIRLLLQKENIEARPLWKPLHLQPIFEKYPSQINGTCNLLFDTGLCLPSGSNLRDADLIRVCHTIQNAAK